MFVTLVDEHADLLGANLVGAVAEHEEHRVDHVRLAAAVRANDRRETLNNSHVLQYHSARSDNTLLCNTDSFVHTYTMVYEDGSKKCCLVCKQ